MRGIKVSNPLFSWGNVFNYVLNKYFIASVFAVHCAVH